MTLYLYATAPASVESTTTIKNKGRRKVPKSMYFISCIICRIHTLTFGVWTLSMYYKAYSIVTLKITPKSKKSQIIKPLHQTKYYLIHY